jgi:DNA-binding SARP family transcriptional activator
VIRFALLGPLAVSAFDAEIPLSSAGHRAVLAMLLLHANRPVSADTLAEALWDGVPPATARASLHNHVMRLRRALGPAGSRVLTRAPGYLIEVRDGELDLDRFTRRRESGRVAARDGSWAEAAGLLGSALDQWTGEPLSNVRSSYPLAGQARRLTELRLETTELRLEAELRLGHHAAVVGELRALAALHPLRERFRELLMSALYADGRQAEALAAYQELRQTLVEEFGLEPGHRIQRLHQQMLAADPALAADSLPGFDPPNRQPDQVVPRQLPLGVSPFAGRGDELTRLGSWLGRGGSGALTVAICGAAGVGKTTLAVHWARQIAGQFPGGQLYLDLRGFSPAGRPADLAEAIRCLLASLGVPARRIPADAQAQVGLYRSLLADRDRVLVLLDNARDAAQVRPLLPAGGGSLAIVTSRRDLAGLAAVDGAKLLSLDVLSQAEASQLLASRLGPDLVAARPAAITELSALCARLPLALAIAAARAALPAGPALTSLVAELRDARTRLDALDTGDQASSLRAVLSWSYDHLSEPAARMFRLLGVQPARDIGVSAAASLAGLPAGQAGHQLAELARVQLLTRRSGAGFGSRFGFHDLLRAYAAERAQAQETPAALTAALGRFLDHYLHTGNAADLLLGPARDPLVLPPPARGVVPEPIADSQQAAAWFETEGDALLAAAHAAGPAGFASHVWQLGWVLSVYLERQGRWSDWVQLQRAALAAATALNDVAAAARSHRALGIALIPLGCREEARSHLSAALAAYREADDPIGQARVSLDLALAAELAGQDAEALDHAERSLHLFRTAGHPAGQGRALNAVGWYYARLGETSRAILPCQQAVGLCAERGDQVGEAAAWDSLGYCHRQLGDYPAALSCATRAVELTGLIGDRYHQADALASLGDTHEAAGDLPSARSAWQQALRILDDLHHPDALTLRKKLTVAQ